MFIYKSKNLSLRHSILKLNEECLTFNDVLSEVSNEFVDCKINDNGNYYIDETYRKSKQNWGNSFCFNFEKSMIQQIHLLYPNWKIQVIKFNLLKYDIGNFFKKHIDHYFGNFELNGKKFNHIGTILVLPPMYLHTHTGGDLVLFINESDVKIIKSDTDEWTIIIFLLNTPHEVLELLSGIRYVFKGHVFEEII